MPRPTGSSHPISHRTVIRHCEEGHRPDVAIRFPAKKETDSHGPSGASE